jgi:hypothetical protein
MLRYRMERVRVTGTYSGDGPQRLGVSLGLGDAGLQAQATIDGHPVPSERIGELVFVTLPSIAADQECRFEIATAAR